MTSFLIKQERYRLQKSDSLNSGRRVLQDGTTDQIYQESRMEKG